MPASQPPRPRTTEHRRAQLSLLLDTLHHLQDSLSKSAQNHKPQVSTPRPATLPATANSHSLSAYEHPIATSAHSQRRAIKTPRLPVVQNMQNHGSPRHGGGLLSFRDHTSTHSTNSESTRSNSFYEFAIKKEKSNMGSKHC